MKTLSKILFFLFSINYISNAQILSICEKDCYRNYKVFEYRDGNENWTVPAGITKLKVELWGAGGSSNAIGGGGGGAYGQAIFTVTPGENIIVYVASVDLPHSGAAVVGPGGNSKVSSTTQSIAVSGGGGSSSIPGNGGGGLFLSGNPPAFVIKGQSGEVTKIYYSQMSATKFVRTIEYGKGGDSGNSIKTGGMGTYDVFNLTSGTSIKNVIGFGGYGPGGGAGSDFRGIFASRGSVIIHY